jgi:hypothetical protein
MQLWGCGLTPAHLLALFDTPAKKGSCNGAMQQPDVVYGVPIDGSWCTSPLQELVLVDDDSGPSDGDDKDDRGPASCLGASRERPFTQPTHSPEFRPAHRSTRPSTWLVSLAPSDRLWCNNFRPQRSCTAAMSSSAHAGGPPRSACICWLHLSHLNVHLLATVNGISFS